MVIVAILSLAFGISSSTIPQSADESKPQVRYDASVPRERQIELATSAAPEEVSAKAAVYILGPKGYEKVREGANGFSCLVNREFVTTMEPECFDAQGSQTTMLVSMRTEELRAQGKSDAEIAAEIKEGYKTGRFKAPLKPGIVYMMSNENWVFDPDSKTIIHFPGHLMFYAPYMTAKDLGYESHATLPYLVHPGQPDALMIVVPASSAGHQH
jgi:hypothetical protein